MILVGDTLHFTNALDYAAFAKLIREHGLEPEILRGLGHLNAIGSTFTMKVRDPKILVFLRMLL